jgi:oxygen-independent coproporphyrinogen-3 oxidase
MDIPLSLYIHIPWCVQKCPYCDFNSHAAKSALPEQQYIDTLLADFDYELAQLPAPRPIQTVFIGGGTPSLLSAAALERLLNGIRASGLLENDAEITLEANPGTFESDKFRHFRQLGVNRLSIGIQSFNNRHLKTLGRIHDSDEARRAIDTAQQAGFDNLNLDLMFGLPQQTLEEALVDVETAIAFAPTHISYYQLTLEPNTYFYQFPPTLPEDDAIFHIQQSGQRLLAKHGYEQYEISAYAQSGKQCRHNRNYWQFGDYLGIGAGAHGKITHQLPNMIMRTTKPKHPADYLADFRGGGRQAITVGELPLEFVMNQLRLVAGFGLSDYQQRTGLAIDSLQPALKQCMEQNLLIESSCGHFRCTEKGWQFLDTLLEKFIN